MTKTEQVYGGALYDLAQKEDLSKQILTQLEEVLALLDRNPDYWRVLSALSIPKEERCQALDQALGKYVHPYLLNFLKILCENGTISSLPGCAKEYRGRYNEDNGIVAVRAVTAIPMKKALREKLRTKLEKSLGKTVELSVTVDPACMGGVRLELPGRQLDGTVKNRIGTLAESLKHITI